MIDFVVNNFENIFGSVGVFAFISSGIMQYLQRRFKKQMDHIMPRFFHVLKNSDELVDIGDAGKRWYDKKNKKNFIELWNQIEDLSVMWKPIKDEKSKNHKGKESELIKENAESQDK